MQKYASGRRVRKRRGIGISIERWARSRASRVSRSFSSFCAAETLGRNPWLSRHRVPWQVDIVAGIRSSLSHGTIVKMKRSSLHLNPRESRSRRNTIQPDIACATRSAREFRDFRQSLSPRLNVYSAERSRSEFPQLKHAEVLITVESHKRLGDSARVTTWATSKKKSENKTGFEEGRTIESGSTVLTFRGRQIRESRILDIAHLLQQWLTPRDFSGNSIRSLELS